MWSCLTNAELTSIPEEPKERLFTVCFHGGGKQRVRPRAARLARHPSDSLASERSGLLTHAKGRHDVWLRFAAGFKENTECNLRIPLW